MRSRLADGLMAVALLLAGGTLLLSQHRALQRTAEVESEQRLAAAAGQLEASIGFGLARSEAATRAVAAHIEAVGVIEPARFQRFAGKLLAGQSAMRALQWEPRVIESQRDAFEAHWQQAGLAEFRLRDPSGHGLQPARRRPVSYPILAGAALDGALPLGLVAASEVSVEAPPLREETDFVQVATLAQAEARDHAEPRITALFGAVTAVTDTAVPPEFRRHVFGIRMPVYREQPGDGLEQRRALLDGFAVAFVALPTLLHDTRRLADAAALRFRLLDLSAAGPQLLYAHPQPDAGFEADHTAELAVLGRRWQLQLAAAPLAALPRHLLDLQLALGLLVLAGLVLAWLRGRSRSRRLEEAQQRLRSLTDGLPVGVFQVVAEGAEGLRIGYANHGAARLLDKPMRWAHDPEGLFDFLDADEAVALQRRLRECLDRGQALQRELLAPLGEGRYRRLQLSADPGRVGEHAVLNGVLEDVTALREAGRQLEDLAEQQSVMLDSLPFGLLIAEAGRISRANPALALLLGHLDADELSGRPLHSLHADEADYRRLRQDFGVILKAGKVASTDWTLVRRDGEAFPAHLVGRKLPGDGGRRELWVITETPAVAAEQD